MHKDTESAPENKMSSGLGGIGEANSDPSLQLIWSDKLDLPEYPTIYITVELNR